MSLRQTKHNDTPNTAEIEKIIREQGTKPFDANEVFENADISDKELEKFLEWRRDIRKSEKEANKSWQF